MSEASGKAVKTAKKAAAHPGYELAARFGYAVRGLLYAGIGVSALPLALGYTGHAKDQRGTLLAVTSNGFRGPLLGVIIVGLVAYSLWGFVRAVWDPLHRGDDLPGLLDRAGFVWSGLVYGSLAVFCSQLLLAPQAGGGDGRLLSQVLSHRTGVIATIVAGLIGIAVGIGQLIEGYRAGFKKDLKRAGVSAEERLATEWLGRIGMVSRGVAFGLMGWLTILAAIRDDPKRVGNMSAALESLTANWEGRLLLLAVCLGFIAMGVHSLLAGRRMRLMSDTTPDPAKKTEHR